MSVNSKMTAIADEIRELSGTTGAMGLDAMATHVGNANTNVSTEADLIAQISSALEGKAAGGGSTGGAETCELTIVQEWGMNREPELLYVQPLAYNIANNTVSPVVDEILTSSLDFGSQHSISITVYKSVPITILISSMLISETEGILSTSTDGGLLTKVDSDLSNAISYIFTPTASTATVTFFSQ